MYVYNILDGGLDDKTEYMQSNRTTYDQFLYCQRSGQPNGYIENSWQVKRPSPFSSVLSFFWAGSFNGKATALQAGD